MGKHWQFPEGLGYEKRAEERQILFLPLVRTSMFSCPEMSEPLTRVTLDFRIHPRASYFKLQTWTGHPTGIP